MEARFNVDRMRRDFRSFGPVGTPFLTNPIRLQQMEVALLPATATDVTEGKHTFVWGSGDDPIRTISSTKYRNASTGAKPMWAEISFDLRGTASADRKWVGIKAGATSIKFCRDGEAAKEVHFDIHSETAGTTDGHPFFHAQTLGMVNDVPRIPVPFVHPIDVLEFALMELFQGAWRTHRVNATSRSRLGNFKKEQTFRLKATLDWIKGCISDSSAHSPMLEFQKHPTSPLLLHEASASS